MALDPSNSSNLEQLALKGLIVFIYKMASVISPADRTKAPREFICLLENSWAKWAFKDSDISPFRPVQCQLSSLR